MPPFSSKSRSRADTASQMSGKSSSSQESSSQVSKSTKSSIQRKPVASGFNNLFKKKSEQNLPHEALATEITEFVKPIESTRAHESTRSIESVGPSKSSKPAEFDESLGPVRMDELRGMVQSSPFIKPLEHKLEAREEPGVLRRPVLDTNISEKGISAITIARRRGETIRILTGRKSDEDMIAIEEEDVQPGDFFEGLATSSRSNSAGNAEEVDKAARKISSGAALVPTWSYYIQCYSKGQFSIIDPPDPPARGPNFKYLPAVKPSNEDERMALCHQYDILWPNWTKDHSVTLLTAAMNKFGTQHASFSIFDDSNEVFKAESGYNQPGIDREMSIAAHVLYTNDVLVILDTQKDWRFEKNPLVTRSPCIRFFAGAPLLSNDGLVLGVFAVWAKEPRSLFGPDERRELAEFGSLLMRDLSLQTTMLSDPDLRSTPRLQGNELINRHYRDQSGETSLIDLDAAHHFVPGLVPLALRYNRSSSPVVEADLYRGNEAQQPSYPSDHTPPPSRENDKGSFKVNDESRTFAEHDTSGPTPDSSFHGMAMMPTLEDLRTYTPRPFSGSDLTSIYPGPYTTPDCSLLDDELSHKPNFDLSRFPSVPEFKDYDELQDFSISSDIQQSVALMNSYESSSEIFNSAAGFHSSNNAYEDLAYGASENVSEYGGTMVSRPNSPQRPEGGETSGGGLAKVNASNSLSYPTKSRPRAALASSPSGTSFAHHDSGLLMQDNEASTKTNGRLSTLWESSDGARQAALACSSFAQQMGYDLIYVAQIKPAKPFMSDEALLQPGGMIKKILTAYGLRQPLDLSSATHLRILRCRGSEHWQNDGEQCGKQEYQYGCLVPISVDTSVARKERNSGLVMGVFRKSRPAGPISTQLELEKLMDFSEHLRDILVKKPGRKPVQRSLTEPASPGTNAYPANEATEFQVNDDPANQKYSFDSRHARRFI